MTAEASWSKRLFYGFFFKLTVTSCMHYNVLFHQMGRDTEKWPIFDRSASIKNGKRGSFKENVGRTDSLPYVEEGNNSGMFTLRMSQITVV